MKVEESKLEGNILYIKYSDKLMDGSTNYLEIEVDINKGYCLNQDYTYLRGTGGKVLQTIEGNVTFSLLNGKHKTYNIAPVEKMTVEDIEKKLGYKVEIISR